MEAALAEAEKFFKPLEQMEYDDITVDLESEDRARYDLTILYAVNALFWMLKRSSGEDPQNHGIKGEMDRIKERMIRLKQIQDKAKMPRVNLGVAERIVRHELNIHNKKKRLKTVRDENWENEKKEEQELGEGTTKF